MKVGDRVRLLKNTYSNPQLLAGETGVIKYVYDGDIVYEVLMDNGHVSDPEDPCWPFDACEVEGI